MGGMSCFGWLMCIHSLFAGHVKLLLMDLMRYLKMLLCLLRGVTAGDNPMLLIGLLRTDLCWRGSLDFHILFLFLLSYLKLTLAWCWIIELIITWHIHLSQYLAIQLHLYSFNMLIQIVFHIFLAFNHWFLVHLGVLARNMMSSNILVVWPLIFSSEVGLHQLSITLDRGLLVLVAPLQWIEIHCCVMEHVLKLIEFGERDLRIVQVFKVAHCFR
jgi:hypothetical protein